jgi:hypothetical protein
MKIIFLHGEIFEFLLCTDESSANEYNNMGF